MATLSEKVKRALADLEMVTKSLLSVDRDNAELVAVGTLLDAKRGELADVEARLERANQEFAETDAAHNDWRQKAAKEQSATGARIDQGQERLRTVEQQVKEAEERHANIIAGIAALSQRLRV